MGENEGCRECRAILSQAQQFTVGGYCPEHGTVSLESEAVRLSAENERLRRATAQLVRMTEEWSTGGIDEDCDICGGANNSDEDDVHKNGCPMFAVEWARAVLAAQGEGDQEVNRGT